MPTSGNTAIVTVLLLFVIAPCAVMIIGQWLKDHAKASHDAKLKRRGLHAAAPEPGRTTRIVRNGRLTDV